MLAVSRWGAVVLAVVALTWCIADRTRNATVSEMNKKAQERLLLYESTLRSAVREYSYLPFILSENEAIRARAAGTGDVSRLNRFLETLNAKAGSAALFIMDRTGMTVASSNVKDKNTSLGQNDNFRSYFSDAIRGRTNSFFGTGVTTGQPGYFMTHPIRQRGETIGVAVVKISFSSLQQYWRKCGEIVFVTDTRGVIILSSNDSWLYRTLFPLDQRTFNQQYRGITLHPLDINQRVASGVEEVTIEKEDFLMISLHLTGLEWDMHYLVPKNMLRERTVLTAVVAGSVAILIILLGLFLWEWHRRKISRVTAKNTERILEVNRQREEEIAEHRCTEQTLRETQEGLIQAGKLAALGQMSAAIVHELNQPIAAIRTYAASSKLMLSRGTSEGLLTNLENISELSERMASVTGQLKTFVRKVPERLEDIDIHQPLQDALSLLQHQITTARCTINKNLHPQPLTVVGDRVRLTQVFVNIIQNALDAMRTADKKEITLAVRRVNQTAEVVIMDTGMGLAADVIDRLFDPFFTTKASGEGMGLGLSISRDIITNLHGEIVCKNEKECGAAFTVCLPLKGSYDN